MLQQRRHTSDGGASAGGSAGVSGGVGGASAMVVFYQKLLSC